MFKPFGRSDDPESKNRNPVGNGLGLHMCKTLTEAMGGEIKLKTSFGFGTTFTITVPLKPASEFWEPDDDQYESESSSEPPESSM